jgi:hypothetical protein
VTLLLLGDQDSNTPLVGMPVAWFWGDSLTKAAGAAKTAAWEIIPVADNARTNARKTKKILILTIFSPL